MRNRRRVLLVDNGSLEPASTLQLRRLAARLEARVGLRVDPVSLAHSTKVPVAAIEGRPAELFDAGLDRAIAEGASEFVIVPLFVGPSHAIARHVPAVVAERTKLHPGIRVVVTPPLFARGDTRLAEILADHVREQISGEGDGWRVAVVDHGSPTRAVTEVRDAVTARVRTLLDNAVTEVAASSMERQPGPEFSFNEPLLENLLARDDWRNGPLVIALLFVGPGRHAGPEGDVAQIVTRLRGGVMDGVRFTPVMGAHSRLMEILVDRVGGAMNRFASREAAAVSFASP